MKASKSRLARVRLVWQPAAIAFGMLSDPAAAIDQNVLPDITVISPTPLPSHARPRNVTTPTPAPPRTTRARTTWAAPAQPAPAHPSPPPAEVGAIERDKVPANTQVITSADLDHKQSPNLLDSLSQALPGVSLTDQTGNAFQRDLNYRGFSASPVLGTPQGLAIYQNGVRVNEVFGDTVNWDFIPDVAVRRLTLVPNNPVFGLNALGGAASIEMKNGFTYQGTEVEALGGSYRRLQGAAQRGYTDGKFASYISLDGLNDDGWRDFSSSSRMRRVYADVGTRSDQAEFHVSFTGADNNLGGTAVTPVQLLRSRWSSVFTWPQTTENQLAFVTANASYNVSDTLALQGNAYFRDFWQHHVDGNNTSVQFCTAPPPLLCFGDGVTPLNGGGNVLVPPGATLGEIDRTQTAAASYGGTAQATSTSKVLNLPNNLIVGASVDHGVVQYNAAGELGTVDQNLFVNGVGFIIDQPEGDSAPVSLLGTTTYTGLFATDTLDITPRLALTGGGRYNVAQVKLTDQLGTGLDSDNRYSRINPVVGLTFKLDGNVTAYGGYSEANRAPTPLELGCSDPARPCLIDSFLVSDPPLKQVVSHTYEAGLRGNYLLSPTSVWRWNVGAFTTTNTNDIISVSSTVVLGKGFFQNAGNTRRQGLEAGITYQSAPWNVYTNYTFVDATFQTPLTLSSPNNPFADANGNIFVVPGDHIPASPQHRFKAGVEYAFTEALKFGADVNVVGPQYLVGDQSNQNPKVPAYAVVNLHGSYKMSQNMELFGVVQNLLNQHYYVTGTFFDTGSFPFLNQTDPRAFVPGMPLAVYAGIRATF
jgi:iron complex outermembrane receptor protein